VTIAAWKSKITIDYTAAIFGWEICVESKPYTSGVLERNLILWIGRRLILLSEIEYTIGFLTALRSLKNTASVVISTFLLFFRRLLIFFLHLQLDRYALVLNIGGPTTLFWRFTNFFAKPSAQVI